ncbi:acyltransferase family protein [Planktotalea arctica]|uniref:acyltransferase family protein n=1 Tax=Planktotalea arctica TaxID=1481893 RepID=UPI000A1787D3|nr:acyltransferase [Planktotalea arctica]
MKHSNNYDFIRLVAATLVIVGHAYALLALPGTPVFFRVSVSTYAVKVFFVLSGYLVVKSWVHDPHVWRFIAKRGLRILPALAGVVVLSAVVMGPFVTTLGLYEYFTHLQFWLYFSNLRFLIAYSLPAVFMDNIYPYAVNGSLWSLPAEVFMYILVMLTGILAAAFSGRWFARFWVALTVVVLGLNTLAFGFGSQIFAGKVVYGTSVFAVVEVSPYFLVGGCLYLLRAYIPQSALLAIALMVVGYYISYSVYPVELALIFITSYAVITLGNMSTPGINQFGRFGDISYGVYLYGFPVAQLLSWGYGHDLSIYTHMGLTILISYLFAFASWHLLEKRALRFKPRAAPIAALAK